MSFRQTLLLTTLAWVLQILAPVAHLGDLMPEEVPEGCQGCDLPERPAFDSACAPDGPCEDPGHHHHHPEHPHDSKCLLCKTLFSRLHTVPAAPELPRPHRMIRWCREVVRASQEPARTAHPARGPPSSVSSG